MRRARGQQGVTLVELLLAIVVLGIIAGPLTAALIVGFKTTGKAQETLSESTTGNLLNVYLARDVQNTDPGHTGGPVGLNAADCRGAGSSAPLVLHQYDNQSVSYSIETIADEPGLTRRASSTGCMRQVVAPGLAAGYQLGLDGTLFLYCGDGTAFTGASSCNANRDNLKMVKVILTTPSGYSYELRGNTRR